ncbi:MAG: N-methyl-L-tryptophan oxidase [Planctomycetota bacterium]
MGNRYDVIVIGVGSIGAAACCHLARRGVRVLGLEQFNIPHTLGAHHGLTRMIRKAYYEHEDYVPLLERAYELWDDLEQDSGEKVLHITGGLYMGPPDCGILTGSKRACETYGLQHELLDRRQLAERYPQFHVPEDFVAFYEDCAGVLLTDQVMSAHIGLARKHGAQLNEREPVTAWHEDEHGVEVTTSNNTYHADHVLFAGGAWTNRLVRDLGVKLTITRQTFGWFEPKNASPLKLGMLPCWFIDVGDGWGHYGFPMLPGQPGFKFTLHQPGEVVGLDTIQRESTAQDQTELEAPLREKIPDAAGPCVSVHTCLYTNSPDSHFIIDQHPRCRRATLACGFSGHGFKFVSVMGELLADLATTGKTDHPVGFLGLDRFK